MFFLNGRCLLPICHLHFNMCTQLSTTDFTNVVDMSGFLSTLLETFKEFKQHEQIENRFIMDRLKRRLSALSVYNSAVCNCHQDNRLTEVRRVDWAGSVRR